MNNSDIKTDLPRWDLTAIYRGFDDSSYKNDKKRLADSFQEALDAVKKGEGASDNDTQWLKDAVKKLEEAGSLYENLYSFCYALYSVNTADSTALKELNSLEKEKLNLYRAKTLFRKNFSLSVSEIEKLAAVNTGGSFFSGYRLFLSETAELKKHQLTEEMEDLVEEILQPKTNSWSKLQEAVSSDLSVK